MIIQLYIKKDTIGLCFARQTDRDSCWTQLGDQQNCAERFGERTIRFYPAKATASFNIALEAEMQGVFVDKPKAAPKPEPAKVVPPQPLPTEVRVVPTAPAPIEPVGIIPTAIDNSNPAVLLVVNSPAILPPEPPPAMIEMPQIGSVAALQPAGKPPEMPQVASAAHFDGPAHYPPATAATPSVAKPPDLRSRAGREWKAKQQAAAQ